MTSRDPEIESQTADEVAIDVLPELKESPKPSPFRTNCPSLPSVDQCYTKSGKMKMSIVIAMAIGGALVFCGVGFLIGYNVRSILTYVSVNDGQVIRAVCLFNPDSVIQGAVYIEENMNVDEGVFVYGKLSGSNDGKHGFHIHRLGNLDNQCRNATAHYNPFDKDHGGPQDSNRHVGDLGNILFNRGKAEFNFTDTQVRLRGETSVVGRAFVVHEGEDDLGQGTSMHSKTTGDAGDRLACCVIGIDKTK